MLKRKIFTLSLIFLITLNPFFIFTFDLNFITNERIRIKEAYAQTVYQVTINATYCGIMRNSAGHGPPIVLDVNQDNDPIQWLEDHPTSDYEVIGLMQYDISQAFDSSLWNYTVTSMALEARTNGWGDPYRDVLMITQSIVGADPTGLWSNFHNDSPKLWNGSAQGPFPVQSSGTYTYNMLGITGSNDTVTDWINDGYTFIAMGMNNTDGGQAWNGIRGCSTTAPNQEPQLLISYTREEAEEEDYDTGDYTTEEIETPIGGIPTNSTEEILEECNATITTDYSRGFFPIDVDDCVLDGVANTTDTDVGDWLFNETRATFFYQFGVPRIENQDTSKLMRISAIIGENYTGTFVILLYVGGMLPEQLNEPFGNDNPATQYSNKIWTNPVKGIYWLELNLDMMADRTIGIAITADQADLQLNETNSQRQLFRTDGFGPLSFTSNYVFVGQSTMALWAEFENTIIVNPDDETVTDTAGDIVTPWADQDVMGNFLRIRDGLGMGPLAGGLFLGIMFIMIFLFLAMYISSRMRQQAPSTIYVGVFLLGSVFNTAIGFFPIYILIIIIFLVAIMTANELRRQFSSGGNV